MSLHDSNRRLDDAAACVAAESVLCFASSFSSCKCSSRKISWICLVGHDRFRASMSWESGSTRCLREVPVSSSTRHVEMSSFDARVSGHGTSAYRVCRTCMAPITMLLPNTNPAVLSALPYTGISGR